MCLCIAITVDVRSPVDTAPSINQLTHHRKTAVTAACKSVNFSCIACPQSTLNPKVSRLPAICTLGSGSCPSCCAKILLREFNGVAPRCGRAGTAIEEAAQGVINCVNNRVLCTLLHELGLLFCQCRLFLAIRHVTVALVMLATGFSGILRQQTVRNTKEQNKPVPVKYIEATQEQYFQCPGTHV